MARLSIRIQNIKNTRQPPYLPCPISHGKDSFSLIKFNVLTHVIVTIYIRIFSVVYPFIKTMPSSSTCNRCSQWGWCIFFMISLLVILITSIVLNSIGIFSECTYDAQCASDYNHVDKISDFSTCVNYACKCNVHSYNGFYRCCPPGENDFCVSHVHEYYGNHYHTYGGHYYHTAPHVIAIIFVFILLFVFVFIIFTEWDSSTTQAAQEVKLKAAEVHVKAENAKIESENATIQSSNTATTKTPRKRKQLQLGNV